MPPPRQNAHVRLYGPLPSRGKEKSPGSLSFTSPPVPAREEEKEEKVEVRPAIQLAAQLAARQFNLRQVLLVRPMDKGSLLRDPAVAGIDGEETDVEGEPDAALKEGDGGSRGGGSRCSAEGAEGAPESIASGDELDQNPKPPEEEKAGQSGVAESVKDDLLTEKIGEELEAMMFAWTPQVRTYSEWVWRKRRGLIGLGLWVTLVVMLLFCH
jgi:hypothetical protein